MITNTSNLNASSYILLYNRATNALKNALVGSEDKNHKWVNGQKIEVPSSERSNWRQNIFDAAKQVGCFGTNIPDSESAVTEDSFLPNCGVNSLEEYYSILLTLSSIDTNFAILPLYIDEEPFTILANERRIHIPDGQNVYAVKGDHYAEVIFFKINRYFDIMDFNATDIYIQWKIGDKSGMSKSYLRDIHSEDNYLIFGWALNKDITSSIGELEFSVRFILQEGTTLKYSYATLPNSITIQDSLEVNTSKVIDPTAGMSQLLVNYPLYNTDTAESPIFETNIGEEDYFLFEDLDGEGPGKVEGYVFDVKATSPNVGGIISYEWRRVTNPQVDENGKLALSLDDTESEAIISEGDYGIIETTPGDNSKFTATAPGVFYCVAKNTFGIRTASSTTNFACVPTPIGINIDEEKTTFNYYLQNKDSIFTPLVKESGVLKLKDLVIDKKSANETVLSRIGDISLYEKNSRNLETAIGVNETNYYTELSLGYKNTLNNATATPLEDNLATVRIHNPLKTPHAQLQYKNIADPDNPLVKNTTNPDSGQMIFVSTDTSGKATIELSPYTTVAGENCFLDPSYTGTAECEIKATYSMEGQNGTTNPTSNLAGNEFTCVPGMYLLKIQYSLYRKGNDTPIATKEKNDIQIIVQN